MSSLVSVIIPAYNARRWIGETLDSVVAQQLDDLETIVIDDGSTDGTADFVQQQYPWVRLESGPNSGVSVARNHGTDLATGQFIQYVDADDVLSPTGITDRFNALEQSGADVAYSDWQRLVETDDGTFKLGELVARTIESVDSNPEVAAFTDFWCPPVALLYRRSIVDRIGNWNERLPIIQDARFLLDALLHGARCVHVAEVGGLYREHVENSLSHQNPVKFVRDCYTNAMEVEEWWKIHGGIDENRRRALVKVLGGVARASFETDAQLFEQSYQALERLEPGYAPAQPSHLRLTSRLIGYRRAEKVAAHYRRTKDRILGKRTLNRNH